MDKEIDKIQNISTKIQRLELEKKEAEKKLVQEIKMYKSENNLTGRQMAKKLNISPQYLVDIEKRRRGISDNFLQKLIELTK
jgi:DNA-binding XRE family transcriptional regulator